MRIYKCTYVKRTQGLLGLKITTVLYKLQSDGAKIVKSPDDIEFCGTWYAIEYDTEDMKLGELLDILTEMRVSDVKAILSEDYFLEDLYSKYISNPWFSKGFRNEISRFRSGADQLSE